MIEQCIGCDNWIDDRCCRYAMPSAQHRRLGGCAMRTHNRSIKAMLTDFVDPLKASKRKSKGIK